MTSSLHLTSHILHFISSKQIPCAEPNQQWMYPLSLLSHRAPLFPETIKTHQWVTRCTFTSLSQTSVTHLHLVQNVAACILSKTNRRSHITPILASLYWLPVKLRSNLKIFKITLKISTSAYPYLHFPALDSTNPIAPWDQPVLVSCP